VKEHRLFGDGTFFYRVHSALNLVRGDCVVELHVEGLAHSCLCADECFDCRCVMQCYCIMYCCSTTVLQIFFRLCIRFIQRSEILFFYRNSSRKTALFGITFRVDAALEVRAVYFEPVVRERRKLVDVCVECCFCGINVHQSVPFISSWMRLFISTAYSSGSSLLTGFANPLTIMARASASLIPRLIK